MYMVFATLVFIFSLLGFALIFYRIWVREISIYDAGYFSKEAAYLTSLSARLLLYSMGCHIVAFILGFFANPPTGDQLLYAEVAKPAFWYVAGIFWFSSLIAAIAIFIAIFCFLREFVDDYRTWREYLEDHKE